MAPEFKAITASKSYLQDALAAASKIVDDAAIVATPEGLSLKAMDESRCLMVQLDVPADYFYIEVPKKGQEEESGWSQRTDEVTKYECPAPVTIGIQLSRLAAALKRIEGYSSHLVLEKEGPALAIREEPGLRHNRGEESTKHFVIPLLDFEPEKVDTEKLRWAVKIDSGYNVDLEGAIKDAKTVGADFVSLNAIRTPETENDPHPHHQLIVTAEGKFGKSETVLRSSSIEFNGKAQGAGAQYSISYLDKIHIKDSEIKFATDSPLQVVHREGYNDNKRIMIRYFLAPRVDGEVPQAAAAAEPPKEAA